MLEINVRPGLAIQMAIRSGLAFKGGHGESLGVAVIRANKFFQIRSWGGDGVFAQSIS